MSNSQKVKNGMETVKSVGTIILHLQLLLHSITNHILEVWMWSHKWKIESKKQPKTFLGGSTNIDNGLTVVHLVLSLVGYLREED